MEDKGFSVMDEVTEMVKKAGGRVEKGSEYCKKHQETHENCIGCESYEGCTAVCDIGIVMMYPIIYKPKSFAEFLEQEKYVQGKMKEIMDRFKKEL